MTLVQNCAVVILLLCCCLFSQAQIVTSVPVDCGPVCMIYCPYGNVLDSRGCPTCQCNEPPRKCRPAICPTIKCAYGLKRNKYGCEICACNPRPVCPMIKCPAIDCPNGFLMVDGCQTCDCNPVIECPLSNCTYIRCAGVQHYLDENGCEYCTCGTLAP